MVIPLQFTCSFINRLSGRSISQTDAQRDQARSSHVTAAKCERRHNASHYMQLDVACGAPLAVRDQSITLSECYVPVSVVTTSANNAIVIASRSIKSAVGLHFCSRRRQPQSCQCNCCFRRQQYEAAAAAAVADAAKYALRVLHINASRDKFTSPEIQYRAVLEN